jgi:hypothetical protein
MTDMTKTITTTGGSVLVLFSASLDLSRNDRGAEVALLVDGTQTFTMRIHTTDEKDSVNHTLSYLVTSLSAASHTFAIHWRVTNSDTTFYQSASTWGAGRSLVVLEVNG